MFLKMATTLKGRFHSYNTLSLKHQVDSITPPECKVYNIKRSYYSYLEPYEIIYLSIIIIFNQTFSVEDTDIDCIRKEIETTKQVIHDLNNLQHGLVKDPLLSVLREASIKIVL